MIAQLDSGCLYSEAVRLGATDVFASVTRLSSGRGNCSLNCVYRGKSVKRGMQFQLATMTEEAAIDWVRECLGAVK